MANMSESDEVSPAFYEEPATMTTDPIDDWGNLVEGSEVPALNKYAENTPVGWSSSPIVGSISSASLGSDYKALELIKQHEAAKEWQKTVNELPLKKYNVFFKNGHSTYIECRYLDFHMNKEFVTAMKEIKSAQPQQNNMYMGGMLATVVGEGFVALAKAEILTIKEVV